MLDLGTAFNLEEPGVSHELQHVLAKITLKTSEEIRHRRHPGEISQVRPAGLRLYVLKDEVRKHRSKFRPESSFHRFRYPKIGHGESPR